MSENESLRDRIRIYRTVAPWRFLAFILRLVYGFQISGRENLPDTGPFIVLAAEYALPGMLATNMLNIEVLMAAIDRGEKTQGYMQEQLWAMRYFQKVAEGGDTRLNALVPHSAGRLSLNLLSGLRVLGDGGIVVMNPEGDVRWDGRPSPVRPGAAWLGLHSGAPVVPALCTTGNYDLWPRWQPWPSRRGRFVVQIGVPFRLVESGLRRASPDDVEQATARISGEFDLIRYGQAGIAEWLGPPSRNGVVIAEPVDIASAAESVTVTPGADNRHVSLRKRGVALLLWRCPVCHTNDALVERRHLFGSHTVGCLACGTRWEMQRVIGKDFRLKVVEGPSELVGLDMALCCWYDEAKRDLEPAPITVEGVDLRPGEQVFLEAPKAQLRPSQPNPLSDGWSEHEAPQAQPRGQPPLAQWPVIGEGRLLLTSHRLLWQGEPQDLDFNWATTTSISLWLFNTLGIRYGTAPYRFELGDEVGLKWLTYAALAARRVPRALDHELTVSPY